MDLKRVRGRENAVYRAKLEDFQGFTMKLTNSEIVLLLGTDPVIATATVIEVEEIPDGGGQAELFNEAHRGGPRVSANPNDRYTRRVSPTSEAFYQGEFGQEARSHEGVVQSARDITASRGLTQFADTRKHFSGSVDIS